MTVAFFGAPLAAQAAVPRPNRNSPPAEKRSDRLKTSRRPRALAEAAADHLDRMAVGWTRQHHCGSCHSNYPFLMARPAPRSSTHGDRRGPWVLREASRPLGRRGRRSEAPVGCRGRLDGRGARHPRRGTTGPLHPLTRKALDRMWTLQKADGGWDWLKCGWPPLEHDDYYGAIVAALAAGHAPDGYAASPSARDGTPTSFAPISGRHLPPTSTTRRCCSGPRPASTA